MTPLLAAKRILCWVGLGSLLIEFCETCGREVEQSWHAPDWAWWHVTGRGDGTGVRCIRCFDREAEAAGLSFRWEPTYKSGTPAAQKR